MGILIGNGRNLYRRASSLVRTPITISLQPDERAVYQVAGAYTSNNFPARGWQAESTVDNIYAVGYNCINAYMQHRDSRQIWRRVNTSHNPETVWYQGAYATSAPTIAGAYSSCEAYIQNGAYHFTIPEGLRSLDVTGVKVNFINCGGIQAYQSPASSGSRNNSKLQGKFDFDYWWFPFAVAPQLEHIEGLMLRPTQWPIDILADYDTCRGARDLWDFGVSTRDGGIPTLTTPQTKSFYMDYNLLYDVNAYKDGFWVIPYIETSVWGPQNYVPFYVNASHAGYWACVCVHSVSLEVSLG